MPRCDVALRVLLQPCPPPFHPSRAGPTTAAGMAAAKGWRTSLVPALLVGILGYATATFIALACGQAYRGMQFRGLA